MKSGSLSCLKYLMFFFNLLFFLCGVAALTVGIWALVSASSFKDILVDNDLIFNGVYIIIAVGAALFLLGFLGCCGALKENRCLLGVFFVFVLIIFIIEVVGAVLVAVYYPEVSTYAVDSITFYGDTNAKGKLITDGWDTLQATIGCCGYNNYSEWQNNAEWSARQNDSDIVPDSCCTRKILSIDSAILNETRCQAAEDGYLNKQGCNEKVSSYIWVVGGVGFGILFFELLAMIFACCLYRAIEE